MSEDKLRNELMAEIANMGHDEYDSMDGLCGTCTAGKGDMIHHAKCHRCALERLAANPPVAANPPAQPADMQGTCDDVLFLHPKGCHCENWKPAAQPQSPSVDALTAEQIARNIVEEYFEGPLENEPRWGHALFVKIKTALERERVAAKWEEHQKYCLYCNQGTAGCDRGRELTAN